MVDRCGSSSPQLCKGRCNACVRQGGCGPSGGALKAERMGRRRAGSVEYVRAQGMATSVVRCGGVVMCARSIDRERGISRSKKSSAALRARERCAVVWFF